MDREPKEIGELKEQIQEIRKAIEYMKDVLEIIGRIPEMQKEETIALKAIMGILGFSLTRRENVIFEYNLDKELQKLK